jgi:hypothetical protein
MPAQCAAGLYCEADRGHGAAALAAATARNTAAGEMSVMQR